MKAGDRIIVGGGHPHAGKRGTVASVDSVDSRPATRVSLDDGQTCHVFYADQMLPLPCEWTHMSHGGGVVLPPETP